MLKSSKRFMNVVVFGFAAVMASATTLSCDSNKKGGNAQDRRPESESDNKDGGAGTFDCGTLKCKSGAEGCVLQRFTSGGPIAESSCQAYTKLPDKDACDSMRATLPPALKSIGGSCFNNVNEGELTLNILNPDGLPLKDKFSDRVKGSGVTFTILDSDLVNKLSAATSATQAPIVEEGQVKTGSPSTKLYCRLIANGGFAATSVPFDLDGATISDRSLFGSRYLRMSTQKSGLFYISFECVRADDTTPFTMADMARIFGAVATIK